MATYFIQIKELTSESLLHMEIVADQDALECTNEQRKEKDNNE
jgi:hypothetical protein